MPGAASKLRDVRKLADSHAAFEFDMPVSELPGLPPDLAAGGGSVQVQLRFGREQGFAIADIQLHARLQVICQRCMTPMPLEVDTNAPVVVVESETEAEGAPAGWETFLAPEGRLSLAALTAEELRLAVPIVPLHGTESGCLPGPAAGSAAAKPVEPRQELATARPFADLRTLLERGGKATK